jgi:multiple sugar transport system permease protein
MADAAISAAQQALAPSKRSSLRRAMQRKSTIAFLMALPLILLIAVLVLYPAFYSIHLAMPNKSMERFVGLSNFTFLFKRQTIRMVLQQSCIFALTAVAFKALIG